MEKQFVCISCPMGCPLRVWEENGEVKVEGNTCPRGKAYGIQEFTAPMRTVRCGTTTFSAEILRAFAKSCRICRSWASAFST